MSHSEGAIAKSLNSPDEIFIDTPTHVQVGVGDFVRINLYNV